MNCPICNKQMELGEIRTNKLPRVGENIYWIPQSYVNEHVNPLAHSKNTIIKNGGVCIPIKSGNFDNQLKGHYCKDCNKLLIDLTMI